MRICFLAPRLPPAVCGLADHTRFLANALVTHGVDVGFIYSRTQNDVCGLLPGPVGHWDGSSHSLECEVAKQSPHWIWVQLSAYGFSRWGAPYRLGLALSRLRKSKPHIRLAICLHEVHCQPRQLGVKGLLLSPWQKHTVGRIARLGSLVFTSTSAWRQWAIQDYAVEPRQVIQLPIGSNIPDAVLSGSERSQLRRGYGWDENEFVAVAFGSFGSQIQALTLFRPFLLDGFEQGILTRVVCLGGEGSTIPWELNRLGTLLAQRGTFQFLGNRPSREIAEILACCDLGLCATPPALLEKSGAFVACASAGLAVLTGGASLWNGQSGLQNLPILSLETWNWRQARSSSFNELRHALRRHAHRHHSWDRIAMKALDHLHASNLFKVR
jgi:hypothetical protein